MAYIKDVTIWCNCKPNLTCPRFYEASTNRVKEARRLAQNWGWTTGHPTTGTLLDYAPGHAPS